LPSGTRVILTVSLSFALMFLRHLYVNVGFDCKS